MDTRNDKGALAATGRFADSHCRHCAAGWTRTGQDGSALTICLLDRELVWAEMTSCDRYERRHDRQA